MSDNNNKPTEPASFDPSPDTSIVREKIKQKPLNKKKLLVRSLFTVMTAALFGGVACFTFFLLEPFISMRISPEEPTTSEPEISSVIYADPEDEISPEDMYATDSEMIEEVLQGNVSDVNRDIENIENMISGIRFGVDDYQNLYIELRNLSTTLSHSVVTVTGITENTDLLNNLYENNARCSGLIVADNGLALLILAKDNGLSSADTVQVTLFDGTICSSRILGKDKATGYLVLAINHYGLSEKTLSLAKPAPLGTSKTTTLKGTPIIALGSPTGVNGSMDYGIITAFPQPLGLIDSDLTLINTDINESSYASGALFTLRGNVIGIIDNSFNESTGSNCLSAIGISELRPLIDRLITIAPKAYLGVRGIDITESMSVTYNLPKGVYLSSVELDSPAMISGLQNGDILVGINGETVRSYSDLVSWLYDANPDSEASLTIERQSVDEYITLDVNVTLGTTYYIDEMEE